MLHGREQLGCWRDKQRTCCGFRKASIGECASDDAAVRAPKAGGGAFGEPLPWPQERPPAQAGGHRNAVAICAAA